MALSEISGAKYAWQRDPVSLIKERSRSLAGLRDYRSLHMETDFKLSVHKN